MARAGHHAKQVRAIVLAMLGGIIWRVDPAPSKSSSTTASLPILLWWVSDMGNKYPRSYSHHTGEI
jgi:Integron cassette protein VCH_CASS1 chain